MVARLKLAGVEQHHPAPDDREGVLELKVVEDGAFGDNVLEQRPQVGDVPLAVAQLVNQAVLGFFGRNVKGLIEGAVGGPDAQGGVEDQQRLAHRVHDVQGVVLNILNEWFSSHPRGPPACFSTPGSPRPAAAETSTARMVMSVLGTRAAAPPLDFLQQGRDAFLEWLEPDPADRLPESSIAELLADGVHRLRDAVRVEVEPVPCRQADGSLLVGVLRQADGEPLAFEDHRPCAGGEMHRAGVSGGNVAELPGHGVQDSVEHRGELPDRRVEGEEPVQAVGDLSGRCDIGPIRDVAIPDQDRGRLRRG